MRRVIKPPFINGSFIQYGQRLFSNQEKIDVLLPEVKALLMKNRYKYEVKKPIFHTEFSLDFFPETDTSHLQQMVATYALTDRQPTLLNNIPNDNTSQPCLQYNISGEFIMFDKKLNSDQIEYNSNNPQSKISRISFSWLCGMRLLQVFGTFHNQAKLKSFDKGVLSAINIGSSHIAVSCDKISTEQLDLILNELEIIEPNFSSIKAELRTVINEKNSQTKSVESAAASNSSSSAQNLGLSRADAEKIESANATLSHLMHSIFQRHGIDAAPRENDFQKARRLYSAAQFEEALTSIRKFKTEKLDSNPYGVTHPEKGPSISISIDTYHLLANCYRQLHRYSDALNTLDEMQGVLHNVLSPASLQEIGRTYNAWKTEADEYAAKQTSGGVGHCSMD